MKKAFIISLLLTVLVACAFAKKPQTNSGGAPAMIMVTSPVYGSTVYNPVDFEATATASTHPITAMALYVDNNLMCQPLTATLSCVETLSTGSHAVTVQSWDSTGYVTKVSGTITVQNAAETITSPVAGSTVTSPVTLSGNGPSNAIATASYVDNNLIDKISASSVTDSVPMADGSHYIVVQSWMPDGSVVKASENVTVSTPTPPPPTATASTVTVTSPTDGSTVASPVAVSASGPSTMAAMAIYVDNNLAWQGSGNTVNQPVVMSAGSHYVVVQGWMPDGTVPKTGLNITVSGTTSSGDLLPNVLPAVDGLTMSTCGACGNSASNGSLANYSMQVVTSPSEDGDASQFNMLAGPANANAYWYHKNYSTPVFQHIKYELDIYVLPGMAIPQAIEFEQFAAINGWEYDLAWQSDYGHQAWRTFNYAQAGWVPTQAVWQQFSTGQWHHVVAEFAVDTTNHTETPETLSVDGVLTNITGIGPFTAVYSGSANFVSSAFQLDGNSAGTAFSVVVDKYLVSTDGSATAQDSLVPVLYAKDSFWNTPVSTTPQIDSKSSTFVNTSFVPYAADARFENSDGGGIALAFAKPTDKQYTINSTTYPMPSGLQVPTGVNTRTVVMNGTQELDAFDAAYNSTSDTWSAQTAAVDDNTSNGECPAGQTCVIASHFALAGGAVRPEEIAQGHIDHALNLTSPYVSSTVFDCPAAGTDGLYADTNAVPVGAWVQLDPSFNVDAQAWPQWEKVVAKTLQTYGAYVAQSGEMAIHATTDMNNTFKWATANTPKGASLANLPWNMFRVMMMQTCSFTPNTPTGLSATAGSNQVSLSWTTATGATGYNVKRSTISGGPYTTIGNVGSASYTDTTASNGTTYYYVVSSVANNIESGNSSQVSATPQAVVVVPSAPTGVVGSAGNAQATISWTASNGATSYHLKRSTVSGGSYATVSSPTGTTVTDTSLTNGTNYYYVVSAVNSAGESANSSQVTVTPQAPQTAPATPTNLSASATNTQVSLTWTSSGGATSYNVKRATVSGSETNLATGVTSTNYTDSAVSSGTTYYYKVSAVNAAGESASSSEVSATVSPTISVATYGATGNGSTDDTAAINTAISHLAAGYTLSFPCGTYLVSSALTTITLNNVTIAGGANGCTTIHATGSGYTIWHMGNDTRSSAVSLNADAAELATTFTANLTSIGVVAGDFVILQEGGKDFSTDSGTGNNTGCDLSGCRGEVLQVSSVSGTTATVATKLHDTYSVSINGATVAKITSPVTGLNMHDLIFDGSGTVGTGVYVSGVENSTFTNVTTQSFTAYGFINYWAYNVNWNSMTVKYAGSSSAAAFELWGIGHSNMNGLSIPVPNQGQSSFGWTLSEAADGTYANININSLGSTTGRPFKTTSVRYSAFNNMTVLNGQGSDNGMSITYYSSHNTWNTCDVENNSGNGIDMFGNYDEYNTFTNCTIKNNVGWQFGQTTSALGQHNDDHTEISGGTITGSSGGTNDLMFLNDAYDYVHGVTVNGAGATGINVYGNNTCVNGNTLNGPFSSYGIALSGSADLANNNVLNGFATYPNPLPSGTCP